MKSRDFYFRQLVLSIGDIVYYVTGCEATYSIKKTRIVDILTRTRGLGIHGLPKMDYTAYVTEDGQIIGNSFIVKRDEMSPDQVFLSKEESIQYIKECLRKEINRQRYALLNAQERLAQAERALKVYEKYG